MLYLSLYTAKVYFVLTVVIIWVVTLRVFVKIYLPKQVFFLDTVFVLLLALMVSYDISTRPINMEGDTLAYHDFYIDLVNGIIGPFDPAFLYLSGSLVYFEMTYVALFWLVPFFLIISYFLIASTFFGKASVLPVSLVACLTLFPFFFSLSANVIRQGFAVILLTFALSMLYGGKRWWAFCFLLFAVLFDKSALICLPLILWNAKLSNISFSRLFKIWSLVSIVSYLGWFSMLSNFVFSQLSLLGIALNYSQSEGSVYVAGFRWDFWLFSSFPIVCMYLYKKIVAEPVLKEENFMAFVASLGILHIALLDVTYNDRFGVYGWFYYPILTVFVLRSIVGNLIYGFKVRHGSSSVD